MTWWQKQFSRDDWRGSTPFIYQSGHYLYLVEEADGSAWLKLHRTRYTTGQSDREDEVRDGLLQATAELIAGRTL